MLGIVWQNHSARVVGPLQRGQSVLECDTAHLKEFRRSELHARLEIQPSERRRSVSGDSTRRPRRGDQNFRGGRVV